MDEDVSAGERMGNTSLEALLINVEAVDHPFQGQPVPLLPLFSIRPRSFVVPSFASLPLHTHTYKSYTWTHFTLGMIPQQSKICVKPGESASSSHLTQHTWLRPFLLVIHAKPLYYWVWMAQSQLISNSRGNRNCGWPYYMENEDECVFKLLRIFLCYCKWPMARGSKVV